MKTVVLPIFVGTITLGIIIALILLVTIIVRLEPMQALATCIVLSGFGCLAWAVGETVLDTLK